MKKVYLRFLILLLTAGCLTIPATCFSQLQKTGFEELDSLQQINKKPVVVFLHTSWCKYCAMMMNSTFKDKEVINALNEKFYLVFFNPEEKKDIFFRNHTFKYTATGINSGINELAMKLAFIDGQLMYPSICVLNADNEIIYQHAGFMRTKEFLKTLEKLSK